MLNIQCSICEAVRAVRLKPHKTPYVCRSCASRRTWQTRERIPRIELLRSDEVRDGMIVFLDRQELISELAGREQQMLRVLVGCPKCQGTRWVRVNSIRNNKVRSTFCRTCSAQQRDPRPLRSGGRQIANGYVYIHRRVLDTETLALADQYLKSHRGSFPEHRIVALIKYGPAAAMPKVVVRHIDGNKQNNDPANIAIGSQSENIVDHMDDRRAAQIWQSIALWALGQLVVHDP